MKKILGILLVLSFLFACLVGCGGQVKKDYTLHAYTRSDSCGAAENWAAYLGNHKQEDLRGTGVYGDPGIAEAVKEDPLGIGYNNIAYAYDMSTGKPVAGLRVVPIDLNENGQIDPEENFYSSNSDMVNAVVTGKYPWPPAVDLYLVAKNQFNGIAGEFVRWILTDGQQYVAAAGFVPITKDKINEGLQKLGNKEPGLEMKGKIAISGAFALYPMVVKWAEEFQKIYPQITIDVSAGGAGKGMTDTLTGMVDLGMISRNITPEEVSKGAFYVPVTENAVVAVINENNPVLKDILAKGIKKQTFIDIWITQKITDWRDVVR